MLHSLICFTLFDFFCRELLGFVLSHFHNPSKMIDNRASVALLTISRYILSLAVFKNRKYPLELLPVYAFDTCPRWALLFNNVKVKQKINKMFFGIIDSFKFVWRRTGLMRR